MRSLGPQRQPRFGCPSQPHRHLRVAFFRIQLRGVRPRALPGSYPHKPQTLGEHLRKRRLDLGLLQRDLAARFRVTETTIGNWERVAERPRIRHLTDILEFIGFDPEPGVPDLAGRLRGVRRRLGLTQADLAIRLGQDEKQICRWERGRAQPHPAILSRVENGLFALEGRPLAEVDSPLSVFDLTRWRRNMPARAMTSEPTSVGDRLRARRLELGMSASLVARRAGTNRGTLYRIERGRQRSTQELEHKLREILELDAVE